ncbi:MAG: restriction endonuclease subunit S [Mariprofundaceae bacterium]|nr:restriction endonuclease subunit S [Mariprofundaceae bacterium]
MSDAMLVPRLRFPEFKSNWVEKYGGYFFSSSREKGNSSLPIYSVTLNNGLVRRDSLKRHMAADAKPEDSLKALSNDLVYNMMRMWQGAVGLASEDCMVSPAYIVLRPRKNTNSFFFLNHFARTRSLYYLWAYSYGLTSDRLRLYFKDFDKIHFVVPDILEQNKIANFLTAVDKRIEQLEKKKRLLTEYKKGVMQQIFSQQIRFKDDNSNPYPDWEEKRLGDICTKASSSLSAASIEGNIGDYPVYGASGYIKSVDYYDADKSYVAIVKDGAGVGRIQYCDACSSALGTLDKLTPSKNINITFLYSLLLRVNFVKYVAGSTIPHIYFKDYAKENMKLPCKKEQQKIADFLTSIDHKIEQVASQLAQAKAFKKGLLQQMFV